MNSMPASSTRLSLAIAAALAVGLSAGVVPTAHAQQSDAAERSAEAERLDTITVSARRREESAQDVPVAVSAFDDFDLVEMQARNVEGLQGAVPNLNIVQGRGSSSAVNVFIRGIGQPDALQTFDPGVGMYVDDVYYSRIQGALFTLFDVERIEVLRGPQGTLYGKNSTGGAIKLVTREPGEEAEGSAELTVGSFGRTEARFYGSTGMGEGGVGFSVAAVGTASDGYVEDPVSDRTFNDDDTMAIRAKLRIEPSDDLSVGFTLDHASQDTELTLGQPTAPLIAVDLATVPPTVVPLLLPEAGEYDFESTTSFGPGHGQELDHTGVAAHLEWSPSDAWTLKSITAWRNLESESFIDIDASQVELGDVLVAFDQEQVSQEFQFQFGGDAWQGIAGLFYLNEKVPSHQEAYANDFIQFGGAPVTFLRTIDDDLETTSVAAFLHGDWQFADGWNLAAGIRYTKEEKEYDRSTSTFWGAPLGALNGTFAFSAEDSWDAITPSVALSRQFSDTLMAYVSANRGFKSGGFNGRANTPGEVSSFDPEFVWTYELGLKMNSEDGRLLGNLAVFHSAYKDFQARVSEVVDPEAPVPTFSFPVLNAAELTINGVEFEGTALIGDATRLSAQVGWMDAEYDEFIDPRIVVDPNLASLHAHVPFSPDWTARVAATHSFYLENGSTFTLGGDVSYRGDTWLSVDNRAGLMQEAFVLAGLFGVWDSADYAWQVRAGVRNLTDEVYKTDGQEFSSVGNIQTVYYGMPRNYYVSVRYNF